MHEQHPDQEPNRGRAANEGDRLRDEPRIYVADLAAYNNGKLHAAWISAAQDVDQVSAAVQRMLAASPEPDAEEWAIHDHEGFGGLQLGEYESLSTLSRLGNGITAHGLAFAALAEWLGTDEATEEAFATHFRGSWPRVEDYAEDLLRDLGAWDELDRLPEWLQRHVKVDVAGFAQDMELGGDIHVLRSEREVHIFDTHG
jgi:antirestriction protein